MNFLPPEPSDEELQRIRQLPRVNIMTDPGIWVCLDEGCNSNCHGKEWAENAVEKLKKFEIRKKGGGKSEFDWVHRRERSCKTWRRE
eukprot:10883277-Karenia_brevis.AAC.1